MKNLSPIDSSPPRAAWKSLIVILVFIAALTARLGRAAIAGLESLSGAQSVALSAQENP